MKILIAEDEPKTLEPYKIVLQSRGHQVFAADNGEDCIKIYREELDKRNAKKTKRLTPSYNDDDDDNSLPPPHPLLFDAVVLDYRMPKKDGMEVAKEILAINPKERIIFASAYVQDTLKDAVKELGIAVELMQKPFKVQALADTIEDTEIYQELKRLDVDADAFKAANPTHEQISNLLDAIRRIQKGRTF